MNTSTYNYKIGTEDKKKWCKMIRLVLYFTIMLCVWLYGQKFKMCYSIRPNDRLFILSIYSMGTWNPIRIHMDIKFYALDFLDTDILSIIFTSTYLLYPVSYPPRRRWGNGLLFGYSSIPRMQASQKKNFACMEC